MFDDTVRCYIAYANLDATDKDIVEVAKLTFAEEIINKLPNKYDTIIGVAKEDIKIGDHVHVHNTGMSDKKKDYEFSQGCKNNEILPESERATFMGYHRGNGKVGTRNFIGIISSVNCSATVCKKIAEAFNDEALSDFENVDGIVSITHGTGCGINSKGLGWELLQATIAGYSRHQKIKSQERLEFRY